MKKIQKIATLSKNIHLDCSNPRKPFFLMAFLSDIDSSFTNVKSQVFIFNGSEKIQILCKGKVGFGYTFSSAMNGIHTLLQSTNLSIADYVNSKLNEKYFLLWQSRRWSY